MLLPTPISKPFPYTTLFRSLPKSANFQVGHSHTACATISKRHVVTRNVPVTASPYAFASKFDEGKPITSATTPVRSSQLIAGIEICPDCRDEGYVPVGFGKKP